MKEALKFLNKPLTIRWYLLNPGYTTCYHHAKHGTTSPLPPPGREGYSLMWTILGFAARQDTVFGLCP